jgi:MYXO-CTERM domain-containing protein
VRARLLLAIAITVACPATAMAQLAPHASWRVLPWSNGRGAGAYDTAQSKMVSFKEHLFDHTSGATSRELLYDQYPGLRVAGQNVWLNTIPIGSASYDGTRGIAHVQQTWNGVSVEQYMWSPFTVDAAVTVVEYDVTNTTAAALTDSSLFVIDNVHVGSGDGTIGEHITWAQNAYEERGAAGLVLHQASPLPTVHAATPNNPYNSVMAGGHLVSTDDSGVTNDAVCGYEWDLSGLAAGATQHFLLVIADRTDGDRNALDVQLASIGSDPVAALAAARADWDAYFARAVIPSNASADEAAVYEQQLAVLRMGQVRADGPGTGQMMASLPTGPWDIAWVRDQAYATDAFVHAGLFAEAKAALTYTWTAKADTYVCCDSNNGPWVGAPYAVSVVRYTGDGVEESDSNDNGPNIEFDGFGLALATTDDYVAASGDTAFITANSDAIFAKTADVLVGLLDGSGATAGLVREDSSIWETHWYNGGRKHFAFTQAAAVRGLRAAADLATRAGMDGSKYTAAASTIAAAFATQFADTSGALRGNLEEAEGAQLDAAAIEALNWDVVSATGSAATATLDAFKAGLWNGTVGHGYHRDDDGGEYDTREWIMIDLRIATAARRAGRGSDSDELLDWVTQQARLNFDLIPENYDKTTGDYYGAVPMVGFGAGAYITALWDRGGGSAEPIVTDGGAGGDAGPGSNAEGGDAGTTAGPPAGGCGCQTCGDAGASTALLALAFGAFVVRRRR